MRAFCIVAVLAGLATPALGQDTVRTYPAKGSFDDVRFELGEAIVNRGYTPHSEGNLEAMLERTGADVGSTRQVYKRAEFVTFCSAKYTRALVEADPDGIAQCPFQLFVYETPGSPPAVVAGYRRLGTGKSDASKKAIAEIEALLDAIVKDAVK
jgi:uncharacterized protein (DUF302 family)